MSFDGAFSEAQERFSEVLQLLNTLHAADNQRNGTPPTVSDNALKGLFLVALYGAFERSTNSAVEHAVAEISSHISSIKLCKSTIFTIFHHPYICSIRDCSYDNIFEKSLSLFGNIGVAEPISAVGNPLANILQNVDGYTLVSICSYFGIAEYVIGPSAMGRLNNLKERRNAVAHGRESAATAGERLHYTELRKLYAVVDEEVTRFLNTLQDYCVNKKYLIEAA